MAIKLRFVVPGALAGMFVYLLSAQAAPPAPQTMVLQPAQVDLSQPVAPGKSHAPVSVSRRFANPALLGQVKAALAADNKSSSRTKGGHGKPSPSPSATPTPTPSLVPISSGAAANPVPTPTSFDAMSLLDTAGYVPPDTTVGAGDTYVVEAVNSQAEVYDKNGNGVGLLNTAACTTDPSTDTVSDPRVLYDAAAQRWFISTTTFSPIGDASWNVLVSVGSDPAVTTWYCLIIPTSGIRNPDGSTGNFPDFPKIGMSADKVALSGDAFSPSGHGRSQNYKFQGTEFIVINKSDLLSWFPGSSSTINNVLFAPDQGDFAIEPAQQLDTPTGTLYMAAVNSGVSSTSTMHVWEVTGVPGGTGLNALQTNVTPLTIDTISYPPNAQQAGTSVLLDTNDDSLLDAVYRDGSLWVSANDACAPGESTVRSCLRFINVDTSAMSVAQDFDYGDPGMYYYYPAIRTDGSGNLFASFTGSASGTYASAYAAMQTTGTPNELTNLSVTRAGDYPYTISPPRWGDYSGAAVDPNDGSVWLGAEYATGISVFGLSDPWWGTAIAHVPAQTP
jgi:hypothetical protein